ncbi:hypothetical protein M5E89_10195 [Acidaminococcus intestini]|nr:hypothetical protein M5E89_10195 [Acidaminococcus intestini]
MEAFLNAANHAVGERVGTPPGTPVIWLSKDSVEQTAHELSQQKGTMYVRLCAAGNILSGEVVVSRLEMTPIPSSIITAIRSCAKPLRSNPIQSRLTLP